MVSFTFLRPTDSGLAPEHRAQFVSIRRLVKWEFADTSGEYSGLLILGEQVMGIDTAPRGLLPTANMTIDLDEKEIPALKVRELSLRVNREFFGAGIGRDVVSFESDLKIQ